MKTQLFRVLILLLLVGSAQITFSQSWHDFFGGTDTIFGRVDDFEIFDDSLFIGGQFTSIAGQNTLFLSKHHGTTVIPISIQGWGLSGVHSLHTHDNLLFAGGSFYITQWGPNCITTWDGNSWEGVEYSFHSKVLDFATYNNELYACSDLSSTVGGSAPVEYIGRWNDSQSQWEEVGTTGANDDVLCMITYQNDLYAAGSFDSIDGVSANRIAKWNGTNWQAVGDGFDESVHSLQIFGGVLYAGGRFTQSGSNQVNKIAKWNGSSWLQVGVGLPSNYGTTVDAMEVYNNELYIGGNFNTDDGAPANSIVKWNGNSISTVGSGTEKYGYVEALKTYKGNLFVGGEFDEMNGLNVANLAYYGTSITGISKNNQMEALKVYPNPVKKQLNVEWPSGKMYNDINVFDAMGRVMLKRPSEGELQTSINVADWDSGIYFIQFISTNGEVSQARFIVE